MVSILYKKLHALNFTVLMVVVLVAMNIKSIWIVQTDTKRQASITIKSPPGSYKEKRKEGRLLVDWEVVERGWWREDEIGQ